MTPRPKQAKIQSVGDIKLDNDRALTVNKSVKYVEYG